MISTARHIEAEILIVGGGMIGLSLAVALGGAGLRVVVVDREDPSRHVDDAFDGRSSAIAWGSRQALAGIGLWPLLEAEAQPILDIRVSDGHVGRRPSGLFLHYDHHEVGRPFGHIVENRVIRRALLALVGRLPEVTHLAPAGLGRIERQAARVRATLADGRDISAELVIAADGRESALRTETGIRVARWNYPQTSIAATVEHDEPHHGVAHEHFLPSGPFAMLPMTGNRSSIVWTERSDLAKAILDLDDEEFSAEIERRFGSTLGHIRILGRRWAYPLSCLLAERFIDSRLALVGDAAHAIHPLAGQGVNLGFLDCAALVEVLARELASGADPAALAELRVLRRYERWRKSENLIALGLVDGLNRLFSTSDEFLGWIRRTGLGAVDRSALAKRFFMGRAMGTSGELPERAR